MTFSIALWLFCNIISLFSTRSAFWVSVKLCSMHWTIILYSSYSFSLEQFPLLAGQFSSFSVRFSYRTCSRVIFISTTRKTKKRMKYSDEILGKALMLNSLANYLGGWASVSYQWTSNVSLILLKIQSHFLLHHSLVQDDRSPMAGRPNSRSHPSHGLAAVAGDCYAREFIRLIYLLFFALFL